MKPAVAEILRDDDAEEEFVVNYKEDRPLVSVVSEKSLRRQVTSAETSHGFRKYPSSTCLRF